MLRKIFQVVFITHNPTMLLGAAVSEALNKTERRQRIVWLLLLVLMPLGMLVQMLPIHKASELSMSCLFVATFLGFVVKGERPRRPIGFVPRVIEGDGGQS